MSELTEAAIQQELDEIQDLCADMDQEDEESWIK